MRTRFSIPPWAAFGACALIWGLSWIAIRAAVQSADPIGVGALRTCLAAVLLLGIGLAARLPRPTLRGAARAMILGTVFIGINFALVYWSAPRLPVGLSALLYSTAPLQAAALSSLAAADRARSRQWLGLLLGLAGIGIGFGGWRELGRADGVVAGAVLLGAFTSATGTALARRWNQLHPVWMNAFANLSGSIVLWLQYLLSRRGPPTPQTPWGWVGFAYMLLGGSILAFLLYFGLLRAWDATRASFTTLVTPFVSLIAGALMLGDPILVSAVAGAALVLAAGLVTLPASASPTPNTVLPAIPANPKAGQEVEPDARMPA